MTTRDEVYSIISNSRNVNIFEPWQRKNKGHSPLSDNMFFDMRRTVCEAGPAPGLVCREAPCFIPRLSAESKASGANDEQPHRGNYPIE